MPMQVLVKIAYTSTAYHVDVDRNTSIGDLCFDIWKLVNKRFYLIDSSTGDEGIPLNMDEVNKNKKINTYQSTEFHIKYLDGSNTQNIDINQPTRVSHITHTCEPCNICMTHNTMITPECQHTLCISCFNRIDRCPYCRCEYS